MLGRAALLLTLAALASAVLAQVAPEQPQTPAEQPLVALRAALDATLGQPILAFESHQCTERLRAQMVSDRAPEITQLRGASTPDLLFVRLDSNGEELWFADTRMIARAPGGAWCRRRGHGSDGAPLPFIPHPAEMLAALANLSDDDLTVVTQNASALDGQQFREFVVTFTGSTAVSLLAAGLAAPPPRPSLSTRRTTAEPQTELTLDVGITVASARQTVVRLHSALYARSRLNSDLAVEFTESQPTHATLQREEDAGTRPLPTSVPASQPQLSLATTERLRAFPVRRLDRRTTLVELDVHLRSLAEPPPMDDAARALLRR